MELENKKQNSIVSYFKNLSQKDKIILSSTIVIAAIVLGLRFVIIPQLENYSSNLNTLELKKAEEAKIKVIPRQNEILEEKNEELKKQYDIALEEISKTPAVAKIIYDLKELIISNNIEIKSINFSSSDVAEEEIQSNDDVKTDENGIVTEIERGIDSQEEEGEGREGAEGEGRAGGQGEGRAGGEGEGRAGGEGEGRAGGEGKGAEGEGAERLVLLPGEPAVLQPYSAGSSFRLIELMQ